MNLTFRRAAPRVLILTVVAVVVTLAFLSNRLFRRYLVAGGNGLTLLLNS